MILVIAEKPSVAQSIAKVLGATSRKDGYMEGGNYIVSWCFGHLVELADASSYDERYAKWRYDDLPIVPESWMFEVTKDKAQQFKVLSSLMKDKRVTELVCATDAGREGELIFRLVYDKTGCTKPFKRLWISSLEDSAIREGFNHLRDGKDYDRLYEAALSRSKADWIVGINGTRLFTTLYHKKLVVGRVQTPTLAMLVERDGKISTFQKEKYFNVHVGKGDLTADLEKVKTEEEAKRIAAACEKKQAVVSSLKRETKTVNPPKLYDLTTLQREANRYYGFTAQQTLDLVQTLYEKKLLTYPRTDSQFITDDMENTARQVISIVCRQLPLFSDVSVTPDIARVIDNSKVTDHHAILPTVQLEKQDVSALPQSEQKILNLVGIRLLCATGEKHTYAETQITLSCEGYEFKTKGKTVVQNGWKAIEELFKASLKTKEKDNPMKSLPEVHEGDVLDSVSASVTEHFTTPPKQYTEDTLLSAMETAGNDQFDDDTEKKGLGTPATRAGIIEKLVRSGFAERKGKSLIPTKDGCNLVCVLPEQITSPKMTAEWENTLMEIERGNADADAFLSGIVQMTGDLVKAYRASLDANVECRRAIEAAISSNYGDNRLDADAAVKSVLEQFSPERVRYILANTIQQKDFDGRIPQPLKEWAKSIDVCPENASRFLVDKPNPGLTALFADAFRQQTEPKKEVTSEKTEERDPEVVAWENDEITSIEVKTVEVKSPFAPSPEEAEKAPKAHRLTAEEKEIKAAVMDTLKGQIAYNNDGMRASYRASNHSFNLLARNGVRIEGNTVTQNGEPLFKIHRRHAARKTQGCYRELMPTLEYVRQEQKQEKPSIRDQLRTAAKQQPEKKSPVKSKTHDMEL